MTSQRERDLSPLFTMAEGWHLVSDTTDAEHRYVGRYVHDDPWIQPRIITVEFALWPEMRHREGASV